MIKYSGMLMDDKHQTAVSVRVLDGIWVRLTDDIMGTRNVTWGELVGYLLEDGVYLEPAPSARQIEQALAANIGNIEALEVSSEFAGTGVKLTQKEEGLLIEQNGNFLSLDAQALLCALGDYRSSPELYKSEDEPHAVPILVGGETTAEPVTCVGYIHTWVANGSFVLKSTTENILGELKESFDEWEDLTPEFLEPDSAHITIRAGDIPKLLKWLELVSLKNNLPAYKRVARLFQRRYLNKENLAGNDPDCEI